MERLKDRIPVAKLDVNKVVSFNGAVVKVIPPSSTTHSDMTSLSFGEKRSSVCTIFAYLLNFDLRRDFERIALVAGSSVM